MKYIEAKMDVIYFDGDVFTLDTATGSGDGSEFGSLTPIPTNGDA